jgi:predicted nucleotidyltransferase
MNEATKNFLEELKKRDDVLGVILFGSWARGNYRENSDVDLEVIVKDGFQRSVEKRDGQIFEIIYTTEKSAFDYNCANKDGAYNFWSVAKILYDKDGSIEKLKQNIESVLEKGKEKIDEIQVEQIKFDAEDVLNYVKEIYSNDPTTANLLLNNKVFNLTENFFNLRQLWTPAPKQRLAKISELNFNLYSYLVNFYNDNTSFDDKTKIVSKIIIEVFN